MDLSVRSRLPEEMDEASLDPAVYQRCLSDLAALNRLTLTHRPVLRWLARATSTLPPGAEFSVLDVAYGQGDLLRRIAAWASRRTASLVSSPTGKRLRASAAGAMACRK